MGLMSRGVLAIWLMRGIGMLLAIPLHESAHAWASAKLGDPTAKNMGRLTLNPFAHFDLMGALCMIVAGVGWAKPVPVYPTRYKNPKVGMALSAAAGPLSNFLAAYLFVVLDKLVYYFAPQTMLWGMVELFLQVLVSLNLSLAIFNLLPVPPFDGSRIATLFLPSKWYFRVMQYERYLFIAMFVLLVMGVFDAPLAWMNQIALNFLNLATGYVDQIYMASQAVFT